MSVGYAIAEDNRQVRLRGVAGQTGFDFDFPLKAKKDLSITRERAGRIEPLSQGEDYLVTEYGAHWGGTIELVQPAQNGDIFDLYGDRDIARASAFTQSGVFTAKEINDEFNKIYMILQEQGRDSDAHVLKPRSTDVSDFSDDVTILAFDEYGQSIRLDASAFVGEQGLQGVRGDKGKPGGIGPRGEIPSIFAKTESGCVIGSISGGLIGEDKNDCDSGDVFSLARAPGLLGYDDNKELRLFDHDEFRGDPGPIGPRGEIPSVVAEGENGVLVGAISGGVIGQDSGNISGNVFSLACAPGVLGFDENGKAKLFGYGDFTGSEGAQGVPGPIGPRGVVPSVIAESDKGVLVSSISGGLIGDTDTETQGYIFSTYTAQNITYQAHSGALSTTVHAALQSLDRRKAGRSDPVTGGIIGQEVGAVRPASEPENIEQPITIYGGTF